MAYNHAKKWNVKAHEILIDMLLMKRSAYLGYNTISNNIISKWCLLHPTHVKKDIKSLFLGS